MSESNVTVKESAIQYGLILGGILAISTVLMYALNQELFLSAWVGVEYYCACYRYWYFFSWQSKRHTRWIYEL